MLPVIQDNSIYDRLKRIFSTDLNIDLAQFTEDDLSHHHLLGEKWRISPRSLAYLVMRLEKEFGITVPQADIVSGRFTTFNKLVEIIHEQLPTPAGVSGDNVT